MPNLPPVAMSVLHALSDGEWHPVLYRYRPAVDVLVARGLAYSGTIDGSFIASHPAKVNKFLGKPYLPAQLKSTVGELLRA